MRNVAFTLSLIFIFFIPWEGVIELPGLGTLAKLVGYAMVVFWLATVVITGRFRKPGIFHLVFPLFILWNAISVFWSADLNRTLTHLGTWVQLFGLVFILWDLYTTRTSILAGLQAFILGEFVPIGIAISKYFSGNVFYAHYQRFSPAAQTNPDGFGLILALGIPVAWYLASLEKTTKMSGLLKLINYTYIPAAFIGLALSGTRGALIAAIPGMVFGLFTLSRLKIWVRVIIFVFLASAIFFLLPYVKPLKSFQRWSTTTSELTGGDLHQRTFIWREGLAYFVEHPILGVGSNMYHTVNSLNKEAHNSFVSVLVELGLIGFILFGIMLVIAIVRAWSLPGWDSKFWLTVLFVWAIGASSLTYEYRKATWLFLGLVISSAALVNPRDVTEGSDWPHEPNVEVKRNTKRNELPSQAEKKHLPA